MRLGPRNSGGLTTTKLTEFKLRRRPLVRVRISFLVTSFHAAKGKIPFNEVLTRYINTFL